MEGQPNLSQVLDREVDDFQKLDNVWRPKNLFFQIQTQELLRDMNRRYATIKANEGEFKSSNENILSDASAPVGAHP